MKSNKGITLVSLIVYIIVMLIIVTIISTITSFFYANVNNEYINNKNEYKNANLEMYLENDLKNKEIWLTDINGNNQFNTEQLKAIKIIYEDFSQIVYSITGEGIYRDSIKIYNIPQGEEDMYFKIENVAPNAGSNISEKQTIKIMKGTTDFKTYTVNLISKIIY